ncbi:MAG: CPBP family intramembrane metalloprotease [Lachnospiraceae bacterium]|nr:CPBP family intramembrane metalloprotease [Lachnospiraceae bacterium]
MEVDKQYKKDFSRLGWRFTIGTVIIAVLQTLVSLIVREVKPEWLSDMSMVLILSVLPLYLVGMPALIGMVSRLPGEAPEKHKMPFGKFLLALMICYSIMYVSNLIGTVLTAVIGMLKGVPVSNDILEIATGSSLWLNFLYMVILAPIFEELVFRKLIVDKTRRYGEGVAVLLSGLMFGLFHGNLSQFAYAFTMGMFFAFLYLRTGNIKITMLLHAIVNFMGSIVSVLILKAVRYEELLELTMSPGYDPKEMMDLVMSSLPGWIVYLLYTGILLCVVITGVVLMIVFRKKFVLYPGEIVLEKGKRFSIIFFNTGMILFVLIWIVTIIVQLFQ